MAKMQKPKHNVTDNPRSRASKRQTSPSIDVDKTIKDAPRASDATPLLSTRVHAGITKSKKKQKPMSRAQRARQEKVLARAEAVQDQMSKKVDGAQNKVKKRHARKAGWDEVNGVGKDERRKAVLKVDDMDAEENAWEDTEDVEIDPDEPLARAPVTSHTPTAITTASHVTAQDASAAKHMEDESDLIT